MGYTTPDKVRMILGLTPTEVSDATINQHLTYIDKKVIKDISTIAVDMKLDGEIDGSNKIFFTEHRYLADQDGDKVISPNTDIKAYTWTSYDPSDLDYTKRTQVTISSIDPDIGKIVLEKAPPSSIQAVTADYAFYSRRVDWTLVELAASLYGAYRIVIAEILLMPTKWASGPLRMEIGTRRHTPYEYLLNDYNSVIELIRKGFSIHDAPRKFRHFIREADIIKL